MNFWLGTHQPEWISHAPIRWFVSHSTLGKRRVLPQLAVGGEIGIDGQGFTIITKHGSYDSVGLTHEAWVTHGRRYYERYGATLKMISSRDWMCEPIARAKTGLSVEEHQRRTIESYLALRDDAPEVPWLPVLQGWKAIDYLHHVEAYTSAGVDLRDRLVGVGSVCRRQGTREATGIVRDILSAGCQQLHLFGFKSEGLFAIQRDIIHFFSPQAHIQSDSLSWSQEARRGYNNAKRLWLTERGWNYDKAQKVWIDSTGLVHTTRSPAVVREMFEMNGASDARLHKHRYLEEGHHLPGEGRRTGHQNCANCYDFAMRARAKIVDRLEARREAA